MDEIDRIANLRNRIAAWRSSKPHKASPMPPELWTEALEIAAQRGIYGASQALGINYQRLKDRLQKAEGTPNSRFVDLTSCLPMRSASSIIVEVASSRGGRLKIDLPVSHESLLNSLVETLLSYDL